MQQNIHGMAWDDLVTCWTTCPSCQGACYIHSPQRFGHDSSLLLWKDSSVWKLWLSTNTLWSGHSCTPETLQRHMIFRIIYRQGEFQDVFPVIKPNFFLWSKKIITTQKQNGLNEFFGVATENKGSWNDVALGILKVNKFSWKEVSEKSFFVCKSWFNIAFNTMSTKFYSYVLQNLQKLSVSETCSCVCIVRTSFTLNCELELGCFWGCRSTFMGVPKVLSWTAEVPSTFRSFSTLEQTRCFVLSAQRMFSEMLVNLIELQMPQGKSVFFRLYFSKTNCWIALTKGKLNNLEALL